MSIQDDIFDVEAALEGKPEAVIFERLMKYFTAIEQSEEDLRKDIDSIREGLKAINKVLLYQNKETE